MERLPVRPGIVARATIDRVIDGDTVNVLIAIPVIVRLKDCWAPEVTGSDKVAGHISKEELIRILPEKSHVLVDIPTEHVDALAGVLTFGRVVGHIYPSGSDKTASQLMVESGHATSEKE